MIEQFIELMTQIHQLLLMHAEAAKGSRSGDGDSDA